MYISINTIPHSKQKYDTVGNYGKKKEGNYWIEVSELGNDDFNFLVALHEMIEQRLCEKRGIKDEDITAFDIKFEKERLEGKHSDEEPGDDEKAPYFKEHQLASKIEKMVAEELGVNWQEYDKRVLSL